MRPVLTRFRLNPGRIAAVAVVLLAAGCNLPGQPKKPDETPRFADIFKTNCSGCHGAEGNKGPAPPLNDDLFRAIVSESDLIDIISEGRPGTPMPPFKKDAGGTLTQMEIKILACEIKGISYKVVEKHDRQGTSWQVVREGEELNKPTWGAPPAPPKDVPPYFAEDGKGDKSKKHGAEVFATACACCHGEQGEGTKEAGKINDTAFLSLTTNQALRRVVITGRPDLGMPDYRTSKARPDKFKTLTSQDVADLVLFLESWRGTTAGGK
jgi:mono/diheme cytochrome c family protein